jgi:hypothetical protein
MPLAWSYSSSSYIIFVTVSVIVGHSLGYGLTNEEERVK